VIPLAVLEGSLLLGTEPVMLVSAGIQDGSFYRIHSAHFPHGQPACTVTETNSGLQREF
jgi:hypothetical protein